MKIKEGDIFSIAVNDRFAIGQVVKIPDKETLSVVLYKDLVDEPSAIDMTKPITNLSPLFFANTFDAKFYHKKWVVIGNNKSDLLNIKLPYYKVGEAPVFIESFDKRKIRVASSQEAEKLKFRKYVAPVRLENAILAYHGYKSWNNDLYESLYYSYNIDSNELIFLSE